MRGMIIILEAVLVYASLVSAINTVNFVNHCPYDLWYWVVGPATSGL
jgi:hypothetical protein